LLSIGDEKSGKLPTPAGVEKSCTRLHQLPNDSWVYHRGDQAFILDAAGELILTVIDETLSSGRNAAGPEMRTGNSWVESAEDEPNSEITGYTAYWTVSSSPSPGLAINERIYLFNGIEGTVGSTTYLLQPMQAYNGSPSMERAGLGGIQSQPPG
jgi:hypothetical protein